MKCEGCDSPIGDGFVQIEDAGVTLRFCDSCVPVCEKCRMPLSDSVLTEIAEMKFCDDCAPFEVTLTVPKRWHGTFRGEPGETVCARITSWGAGTVELYVPDRWRMILPR